MNWFKKIMYDRYGGDELSLALLILAILLSLISSLIHFRLLVVISYVPLLLCLYRMFSKDFDKRRSENSRFLQFYWPLKNKVLLKWDHLKDLKDHKYYKCPQCHQTLRVPRGKGSIRITCPKCKHEFSRKS